MSWLLKSLQTDDPDSPTSPSRNVGLKEDLSELGQTIGRQLRGVASFLAPPPSPSPSQQPSDGNPPQASETLVGIRSDLAEIGGSFKSGFSVLSGNKAVSEISRFASSLWQFESRDGDEDDEDFEEYDGVPGTADDTVGFVRQISTRPELWTDFPMPIANDFKMSQTQREHASVIEDLVPSLAAVKSKVQSELGERRFWMIYFILLLPRLNEDDFALLSTPQVLKTRDLLLKKLQSAQEEGESSHGVSEEHGEARDSQAEAGISEITNRSKRLEIESEEENEQWLEEADVPGDTCAHTERRTGEEADLDVSFSDLEDEGSNNDLPSQRKSTQEGKGTSPTGSSDWVQLNEGSETQGGSKRPRHSSSRDKDSEGESSDWLAVDDFD